MAVAAWLALCGGSACPPVCLPAPPSHPAACLARGAIPLSRGWGDIMANRTNKSSCAQPRGRYAFSRAWIQPACSARAPPARRVPTQCHSRPRSSLAPPLPPSDDAKFGHAFCQMRRCVRGMRRHRWQARTGGKCFQDLRCKLAKPRSQGLAQRHGQQARARTCFRKHDRVDGHVARVARARQPHKAHVGHAAGQVDLRDAQALADSQ